MVKQLLETDLKKVMKTLGYGDIDIVLSISEKSEFGDYSSNLALQLAKQESKKAYQNPKEIANKILEKLGHPHYLERIEIAGSGFINFFIKPEFIAKDLEEILKLKLKYGSSNKFADKKASVEFVSANPTGPLHIGNARGGPIGDVIANVLSAVGYEVLREYIHNDVGNQVIALGATINAYLKGESLEDQQYQGEYIKEIAEQLREGSDNLSDEELGRKAVEILFSEIVDDAKKMGINFDKFTKESDLRQEALPVLDVLENKGYIKNKDGAKWFAPNDEFLKDRETVVIKSDGGYTYYTSDIVYHSKKFRSGMDLVIDIFGSGHHGHVPRLQAAVAALGYDTDNFVVILYQNVRIKRGEQIIKMSKRAGNFITAREVLDEIGKDALRFWLLRFSPQTHIDLDLDLLKEQSSKNPVFYVKYAHARMANILAKVEKIETQPNLSLLIEEPERDLIKYLLKFPDLVEAIANNFQVHQLSEYALSLADLFHKFYEANSVLFAGKEDLKQARLSLVLASKITLANTFNLLGIEAPERM